MGGFSGVEVAFRESDTAHDRAPGVPQLLHDCVAQRRVHSVRLHHDDPHVGEPAVEHHRLVGGDELRGTGVELVRHILVGAQPLALQPQLLCLLFEGVQQRVLQHRAAQHDADSECQEDRDCGDQVVAEVDHAKSPVSQ